MIRLPKPPMTIITPSTPEQYARKFLEISNYLQNLVTTLETQQNRSEFQTESSNVKSEDDATAKGFFFG